MIFDKEQIKLDIDILVRRINDDIDGYYREYYIYPERNILREIYNNLQKASISCGKLVGTSLTKNTILGEFASEDDSKIIKICFQNIIKIILNNYDIEIANIIIKILNKIQEYNKRYLTDIDYETLNEIIVKISLYNYLKFHKEYEKVKDLFYLYKEIDEEYNEDIKRLLGNKIFLEEFYKKLSVIPTIEDKYFKSTICEYFKDRIEIYVEYL